MKALIEEMNIEIAAVEITPTDISTHEGSPESPSYTEMMIEIQKIGDPVSFESLKEFYNIS